VRKLGPVCCVLASVDINSAENDLQHFKIQNNGEIYNKTFFGDAVVRVPAEYAPKMRNFL
jgi:hypothetical protein